MRPLRTFTIQPSLPPELQGLLEIAYNLRWSWTGEAQDLFRRLMELELMGVLFLDLLQYFTCN